MWRIKMMKTFFKKYAGFTLLEMLLVLVIIISILSLFVNYTVQKGDQARRDRLSMEIQQILNASLAYYLANGVWPDSANAAGFSSLLVPNYLPNLSNPYGLTFTGNNQFLIGSGNNTAGLFFVCAQVPNQADAQIVASSLPLGFIASSCTAAGTTTPPVLTPTQASTCTSGNCYVVGGVNVPGQNVNNARSVNFGALYRNGACVPAPSCPGTMISQILVVPSAVSGIYNNPGGGTPTAIPVSSFTAYALGNSSNNPVLITKGGSGAINSCCTATASCGSQATSYGCYLNSGDTTNTVPTGYYWRVCLAVVTESGAVTPTNSTWGTDVGSVLAITRCVPANSSGTATENFGSDFTVWGY
jgi:type II secretory pathway pseudopilin PulG